MAAVESLLVELKRFVRFDGDDEASLRALSSTAEPHLPAIADRFYQRLLEHEGARAVLTGPTEVERLKLTLRDWMRQLIGGPWDEDYFQRHLNIGRVHVRIGLPERYVFGAMDLIRSSLSPITAERWPHDEAARERARTALQKVTDLELAILSHSYREAFVARVKTVERNGREVLERALALSEERYEQIIDQAWSLITTCDADGVVLFFNRRCEELTGLSRAQAVGHAWEDLFAPEGDRAEVRRLFGRVGAGSEPVGSYEGSFRRKPDGEERRVRWHVTTLPSKGGPVLCAIGSNVTEEQLLALRTRRAERLAALGTMAAGLAHEIRNPLNAAHLQLAVMKRRIDRPDGPDLDGAREAAELVSAEMRRLSSLVDEFLLFSRPQALQLGHTDLAGVAAEVVALLQPVAQESGATLELHQSERAWAHVDAEKIKQVLLNLLRNALESTGRDGRVTVRVADEGADGVRLDVEDNGPGLSSPDAPIFEPFFTTKPQGTGLGLSIVHRIVGDHGGKVAVDSRPGRTIFSVHLPA